MPKPVELAPGTRFGKLTVLSPVSTRSNRKRMWLVRCDCGKEVEVVGSLLKSGKRSTCGCSNTPGSDSRKRAGEKRKQRARSVTQRERAVLSGCCTKCGGNRDREPKRPIGSGGLCRPCAAEASAKYRRGKGYQKSREANWVIHGIKMWNGLTLTYAVYSQVLEYQGGCCALCNRAGFWTTFHADHDKKSGLFRGVLCSECNRYAVGVYEKVGHFKSSEHERLIAEYLENPPYGRWREFSEGLIQPPPVIVPVEK